MTITKALLLGLIQGLTEFLPVSSSGHLVITQHLLGINQPPIMFDVFVHTGTLIAIILIFQKEIRAINKSFFKAILIGSIPTAIIGLILNNISEILFSSVKLIGVSLLVTSAVLISTKFLKLKENNEKINTRTALTIGIAQGIAVIPGISRSGITITSGLWMGLNSKTAIVYSFLLSIPAIIGAQMLQFSNSIDVSKIMSLPYISGFLTAAISGWFSLKILKTLAERSKLHFFAFYTLTLAMLLLFS